MHARAHLGKDCGEGRAGNRQDDEVHPTQVELEDGLDLDGRRELDAWEVDRVLALGAHALRLRGGATAELNVEARARQHDKKWPFPSRRRR